MIEPRIVASRPQRPRSLAIARPAARIVAAVALVACGVDNDNEDDDGGDADAVVLVGGYPLGIDDLAGFAAAGWYWAGDAATFFAETGPVVPVVGDEPDPLDAPGPASALRRLALGADACPENVTITPVQVATPCGPGGMPQITRGGATLVFDACELPGGSRLSGTVDVMSTHSTMDASCDADTIVSVEVVTRLDDIAWVTPAGTRVEIPELSQTTDFAHRPGLPPDTLSVHTTGRLRRFFPGGDLELDLRIDGRHAIELEAETGASSSTGTFTVDDLVAEQTRVWGSQEVRREPSCCRPVGGTIVVTLQGADGPEETETWRLGPSCREARRDGELDLLPGCP